MKKLILKKKQQQMTIKHAKLPSMQRVNRVNIIELFSHCKGGNLNIHILAWLGYFICSRRVLFIWQRINKLFELYKLACISCYIYLGDNCIQNFHLGRYIVGYTVGNLVLRQRISNDIPPQMYILNMVIPILMHFCSLVSNWSFGSA